MAVGGSHRSGDKVGLKRGGGKLTGARGVIELVEGNGALVVRIVDSNKLLRVRASGVTNFSLAARKAWRKMPDRRVGRPKGSKTCDRVSVTLRLDRDLWERFRLAEKQGRVPHRTSVVNDWIRVMLSQLLETSGRI